MQIDNEFWAIDFDRCIGNAGAATKLLGRVLNEVAPEVDVPTLEAARSNLELAGGSFDMLAYVRDTVEDVTTYQRVIEAYIAMAASGENDLQQPGTRELLGYLDSLTVPYGIVSYGHVAWQELKITAAGLGSVPRYIVSTSRKGEIIASWQQADGVFHVPSELQANGVKTAYQSIVLVDDKAVSFMGLPNSCRGYWVRGSELLASQEGEVPPSVMAVASLMEIVDADTNRRHSN